MGDYLVLDGSAVLLGGAIGFWLARELNGKVLDFKIIEEIKDCVGSVEVVVN